MSGREDVHDTSRRNYKQPHSGRNPIPTVQQYRDYKQKQRQNLGFDAKGNRIDEDRDSRGTWPETAQNWWHGEDRENAQEAGAHPGEDARDKSEDGKAHETNAGRQGDAESEQRETAQDTSQASSAQGVHDPKQKRKQMKKAGADASRAEREVTDPVTHLPITIHDYTGKDLQEVADEGRDDDNDGIDDGEDDQVDMQSVQQRGRTKSDMQKADSAQKREHGALYNRFPPPQFDGARQELMRVQKQAALFVLVATVFFVFLMLGIELLVPDHVLTLNYRISPRWVLTGETLLAVGFISLGIGGVQSWSQKQARHIWDDAVWAAQKQEARQTIRQGPQETTLWLSKLIGSIWPLVNPDLFTSIGDTLEDVMQASLPRMVRMVSVEDIGQGSEPLRILGVKWLPKGAAGRSVDEDGQNKKSDDNNQMDRPAKPESNDQKNRQGAQQDGEKDENKDDQVATEDSNEGLGAEEGEFVNIEIAFAYRASRFQKKLKDRQKNAHLLLAFYLPGNIKLPVWVELRGIVGSCRARLQLTPDPPFIALCTLTFLGQPEVDMTCVPLVKKGLNIMDLPLISNFVQSSINAALSEYVAPKSIPLDLQAMLAGDDFKKDTAARGVLVCRIKRAFDFKASDMGMPLIGKEKSSDAYVSVSWAKFGKPLWSTRIILADMHPCWEETAYLLVGPEELDAEESVRVQLWDSDKFSADDDLGRIELVLKDLMKDEQTNGKMQDRQDSFKALQAGKGMPGSLEWSVGYYSKVRLLEWQMKAHVKDKDVETIDQLKQQVYQRAEKKLRETAKNESGELQQLKEDDWEAEQINMITSSEPSSEYPSGILSVHVHQIVGLSMEDTRKNKDPEEEEATDANSEDHLPDSYCTMILNDNKIFRTRTKPKNSAPFFNACTERFIRDWRTATVMLSVRDQRVHEDDTFLGHVYLDIGKLFREHKASRINSFWPIAGGIGYGRLRVSLVFRSANMQMPPRELGWDTGVIEVAPEVFCADSVPKHVAGHRINVHTNTGKGKMHSAKPDGAGGAAAKWTTFRDQPLLLAVRKRYASNLIFEFKSSSSGIMPKSKKVVAFCLLWLKDMSDEEWTDVTLPIYKDDHNLLERASANCLPESEVGEDKVGELKVRVKFWRGLGTVHKKLAKTNMDVANVLEVRDAARELGNGPAIVGAPGWRKERDPSSNAPDAAADDSDTSDDDTDNKSKHSIAHKISSRREAHDAPEEEEEHGHKGKFGNLAHRAHKHIPFTKAHKDAKHEDEADGVAPPPTTETTSAGQDGPTPEGVNQNYGSAQPAAAGSDPNQRSFSVEQTQSSQEASSAPHATIGPTHGGDAVKDELNAIDSQQKNNPQAGNDVGPAQASKPDDEPVSTDKPQRSTDGAPVSQYTSSDGPETGQTHTAAPIEPSPEESATTFTAIQSQQSHETPSAAHATKEPSHGTETAQQSLADGKTSAAPSDENGSATNPADGRPATSTSDKNKGNYSVFPSSSSNQASAPGTPTHSRPTTGTSSLSNAPDSSTRQPSRAPSTPKTSMSTARDNQTPSPDSSAKRRSGVFGSLKRSFSLKSSPLTKEGREKRASRLGSSSQPNANAPSSSNTSTHSRTPSTAVDRSPLASHPTGSSAGEPVTPTQSNRSGAPASSSGVQNTAEGNTAQDFDEDDGNEDNSNREQLHRRHRGVMQFKGPRTANWIKHKAEGAVGEMQKMTKHEEREKVGGLEREV